MSSGKHKLKQHYISIRIGKIQKTVTPDADKDEEQQEL